MAPIPQRPGQEAHPCSPVTAETRLLIPVPFGPGGPGRVQMALLSPGVYPRSGHEPLFPRLG